MTAFYGTLIIKGDSGKLQVDQMYNADTANAYSTFTSTGGLAFIDVNENGYITDLALSVTAVGTTTNLKLWINQTDTGIRWHQSLSFPNLNNRMFNLTPVRVLKGQRIQVQAL